MAEGLYYLCSEKGTDQLRGYCAADSLCFFAYAKSSFSRDAASLVLKVFLQIFSPPHTVNGEKMDIK